MSNIKNLKQFICDLRLHLSKLHIYLQKQPIYQFVENLIKKIPYNKRKLISKTSAYFFVLFLCYSILDSIYLNENFTYSGSWDKALIKFENNKTPVSSKSNAFYFIPNRGVAGSDIFVHGSANWVNLIKIDGKLTLKPCVLSNKFTKVNPVITIPATASFIAYSPESDAKIRIFNTDNGLLSTAKYLDAQELADEYFDGFPVRVQSMTIVSSNIASVDSDALILDLSPVIKESADMQGLLASIDGEDFYKNNSGFCNALALNKYDDKRALIYVDNISSVISNNNNIKLTKKITALPLKAFSSCSLNGKLTVAEKSYAVENGICVDIFSGKDILIENGQKENDVIITGSSDSLMFNNKIINLSLYGKIPDQIKLNSIWLLLSAFILWQLNIFKKLATPKKPKIPKRVRPGSKISKSERP